VQDIDGLDIGHRLRRCHAAHQQRDSDEESGEVCFHGLPLSLSTSADIFVLCLVALLDLLLPACLISWRPATCHITVLGALPGSGVTMSSAFPRNLAFLAARSQQHY